MGTLLHSGISRRIYQLFNAWHCLRLTIVEVGLVSLVVTAAIALRCRSLDVNPFWVDEAESSINALTILQRGYPTDSYLGLPIYENTLIKPWPGNLEYAFRDISYSENHMAVYHGWLPLYSIAASFALQHVRPDQADGTLSIKHGPSEWKRRTRAARLPAVFFGALFLLIAFYGAGVIYGRDAGWAALIVGAIHPWHIAISREARYYSAQITLTTACCVLLWLTFKHCTWKRTCATALAFVLLFYTNLLSFCTGIAVFLIIVPLLLRRRGGAVPKLIVFAAIVATGTLPWIIITGFYAHESSIPRAWPLLTLPADILRYPPVIFSNALIGAAIVLLLVWVLLLKPPVSTRFRRPAARLAPLVVFLGTWAACGYATFLLFIPAVSFDSARLRMSYWGPLFLLESAICAAIARCLMPRFAAFLAPIILLLLFLGSGKTFRFGDRSTRPWKTYELVLDQLQAMHLQSNTRLYAAPNGHLVLTFYSGLPIQDITPVRKSYLDAYKGDIVYIDSGISVETGVLTPDHVRETAFRDGCVLSMNAARQLTAELRTRRYREAMLKIVKPGATEQLVPLPSYAQELLRANDRKASLLFANTGLDIVTRNFEIRTWADWVAILKYRFVDPAMHSGARANYAERLEGADTVILPDADTVLYYSRWHPPRESIMMPSSD
jgi:hypothetical protein